MHALCLEWPERGCRTAVWGRWILTAMATFLIGIGSAALLTALSVVMLPHEVAAVGADAVALHQHHHDHTLVSFIVHNRVSFGGALMAVGVLYLWLIRMPLAQGKAWAWWVLLGSAGIGTASFFSFVPKGYFDPVHAGGTAVIVLSLALGLAWTRSSLAPLPVHSPGEILARVRARFSLERALLTIWAGGTLLGGTIILLVGMFPVFVVEDLHYMQISADELARINPGLISYIGHDRSGFGGALMACGLALVAIVWFAEPPLFAPARRWLALVWTIGVFTAIGVHPWVGYNSLSHLLPFLVKDGAFLLALALAGYNKARNDV